MAASTRVLSRTSASTLSASRLTQGLVSCRPFHSYDHPPPPGPFGDAEKTILTAAYKHVPELGFSQKALGRGARDAGYLDISASVIPDGAFGLIRYHLITQREALAARSKELFPDSDQPGVAARVEALTWERLMGNKEILGRWQEALAVMAQPSYVPESIKELAKLSDEIWFLAGDKAVDPSWYTKRATLSMIYSTSELFMTNDRSPDFVETRQFLQRRLGEVKSVGGMVGSFGQWAGYTLSAGVNILRSKGVRV
ncbi:Ubiquinone biosynthesis protein coq9, mitochondrial [Fusarium equiseti]|uniref:Ubiquinone biosynthesis protein n=1 Tax=Fusarium equiseti TaxID=61235 RepID=A0ABQ8RDN9_FUSEQ|nr:Ubiquinone biosynthesis protein coq9, mitochondrial [Fusarium equiseti]